MILGLDISTYVGLAKITGDGIVGKCVNFPNQRGWPRLQSIADEVSRVLDVWKPDNAVIEAYAIYRVSSVVAVVSVGTVVRKLLYDRRIPWVEVPPTTLKKFATGKGNAQKNDMAAAAKAKLGYNSPSDDIIDAVWLAKLGEHLGVVGTDSGLRGIVPGW